MSTRTEWTDARLARLFERYQSRYWPRSRRLRRYGVEAGTLAGEWGLCDEDARVLRIDIAVHSSDREVRATLLHEMIHAVVGVRAGHGAPFWAQLEYLLSLEAPITISFPELGERGRLRGVIPARFRRCRQRFRAAFAREQRAIRRLPMEMTLTPTQIETECEDFGRQGVSWRVGWPQLAAECGFVDLDRRLRPWARRYHQAARRGYSRGRRDFLLQSV